MKSEENKDSLSLGEKAALAIENILNLTRSGQILWEPLENTDFLKNNQNCRIDQAFICVFNSKAYVVCHKFHFVSDDGIDYYWGDQTHELFLVRPPATNTSGGGKILWKFPNNTLIADLFETALIRAYQVEDALDEAIQTQWI